MSLYLIWCKPGQGKTTQQIQAIVVADFIVKCLRLKKKKRTTYAVPCNWRFIVDPHEALEFFCLYPIHLILHM